MYKKEQFRKNITDIIGISKGHYPLITLVTKTIYH